MNISCMIVEDEPLAMERNKNYVRRIPYLQLLGCFDNAKEALHFLQKNTVQLILLDVNLGHFSGIDLLQTGNIQSEIILITAYEKYALQGYELNVTDYLLKPYQFERFKQAIEKVRQKLTTRPMSVFIRTAHRVEKVQLDELLYIEGMRDYRKLVLLNKPPILTLQTFTDMETTLPANLVCRVHKSYMVAIDKIEQYDKRGIRIQQKMIPVSDSYRKKLQDILGRNPNTQTGD